jgi:hypothetical protein
MPEQNYLETDQEPDHSELPYEFNNEEELRSAILSETYNNVPEVSSFGGYFVPNEIPADTSIRYIHVKSEYILVNYNINGVDDPESEYLIFEWKPLYQEGDELQFVRTFVSEIVREEDGRYIIDGPELQVYSIYYSFGGKVFHVVVPKSWSKEQVNAFCTPTWVPVTQVN